jgi:hypothetical protein
VSGSSLATKSLGIRLNYDFGLYYNWFDNSIPNIQTIKKKRERILLVTAHLYQSMLLLTKLELNHMMFQILKLMMISN